ncbi:MAG: acyl-CoA dehydrogenase family protein [Myxococcota bacterium]|nr:acyl-CoA dehydrogenase family protein [Myxococcota bacterium]
MDFNQAPPELGNQYDDDALLQEYLERNLGPELLKNQEEQYRHLGDLGGRSLYRAQLEDRLNEPTLNNWDAWGNRIDQITLTPLWQRAKQLTAEHGLIAAAYEQEHGPQSRIHQFAANYLIQASLDVWSCPLAMTDGAARTLLSSGNTDLIERAVGHLTSRNPETAWTSGQWMTEKTGGSDVGICLSRATETNGQWRLHGTKWFTSATTSEMALTLARPENNPEGGRGLALFYVETRDEAGALNGITIHRLKDKLGTRKVPTAELRLDGTLATPVCGLKDGTRNIAPMLNITRTWNAMAAVWGMRRGVALARDFAGKRRAFGALLSEKPLHQDTLAGMQAQFEAAFHLAWRCVSLAGRLETGEADETEEILSRILTPIAKLTTARQAVALASETLECFGGAGYIEDTGLPRLLADAQVLSIWEGTTNVLSLDVLRALAGESHLAILTHEIHASCEKVSHPDLIECADIAMAASSWATEWLRENQANPVSLESGARRFALTLGHAIELSHLASHAQWSLDNDKGPRAGAAARRFAQEMAGAVGGTSAEDTLILATG